jgi:hypothetical protein
VEAAAATARAEAVQRAAAERDAALAATRAAEARTALVAARRAAAAEVEAARASATAQAQAHARARAAAEAELRRVLQSEAAARAEAEARARVEAEARARAEAAGRTAAERLSQLEAAGAAAAASQARAEAEARAAMGRSAAAAEAAVQRASVAEAARAAAEQAAVAASVRAAAEVAAAQQARESAEAAAKAGAARMASELAAAEAARAAAERAASAEAARVASEVASAEVARCAAKESAAADAARAAALVAAAEAEARAAREEAVAAVAGAEARVAAANAAAHAAADRAATAEAEQRNLILAEAERRAAEETARAKVEADVAATAARAAAEATEAARSAAAAAAAAEAARTAEQVAAARAAAREAAARAAAAEEEAVASAAAAAAVQAWDAGDDGAAEEARRYAAAAAARFALEAEAAEAAAAAERAALASAAEAAERGAAEEGSACAAADATVAAATPLREATLQAQERAGQARAAAAGHSPSSPASQPNAAPAPPVDESRLMATPAAAACSPLFPPDARPARSTESRSAEGRSGEGRCASGGRSGSVDWMAGSSSVVSVGSFRSDEELHAYYFGDLAAGIATEAAEAERQARERQPDERRYRKTVDEEATEQRLALFSILQAADKARRVPSLDLPGLPKVEASPPPRPRPGVLPAVADAWGMPGAGADADDGEEDDLDAIASRAAAKTVQLWAEPPAAAGNAAELHPRVAEAVDALVAEPRLPLPRPRPERPVLSPRGESRGNGVPPAPVDAVAAPAAALAWVEPAHLCTAGAPAVEAQGKTEDLVPAVQPALAAGTDRDNRWGGADEAQNGVRISGSSPVCASAPQRPEAQADLAMHPGDVPQDSSRAAPARSIQVGACTHASMPANGGVCMMAGWRVGAPAATLLGVALNTPNVGTATCACAPGGGEVHCAPASCHCTGPAVTPATGGGGSMVADHARNGVESDAFAPAVAEAIRRPCHCAFDSTVDRASARHAAGRWDAAASRSEPLVGATADETQASLALRAGWAAFSHQTYASESLQAQYEARRSGRELLLAWLMWRRLARDARPTRLSEAVGARSPPSKG